MTHADRLLAWYDRHRRTLPWRAAPGERTPPYRVWLSEIMLQQTTVATVGEYFRRFVERWPTVEALAEAPLDEVLSAWAGLGYYARARNLHACAQAVANDHGGRFPEDEAGLLALPGIGRYTAAAIQAIAFDQPASAVDGNVERVIVRLYAIETPLPDAKPDIQVRAARLVPQQRAGDYAQAMMDLGATICSPRNPRCVICPLMQGCKGRKQGIAEELPRRAPKAGKPTRRGLAFVLLRKDGAVLLRKRPAKGLLGGMDEVPSSAWREGPFVEASALTEAPVPARWTVMNGLVRHTFTHFHLELTVARAIATTGRLAALAPGTSWSALDKLDERALPTVMRKVIEHAVKA
ncbi:MAG: A/G-specific adenine glycosylase [Reyranella sp.]|uniref:A/G-specific adenine glycosylase n=1 Tax=Reyranella sp. TaxID=1929291 RepID=UPI0012081F82|nr:A/G-specific adenine glycosylase [Reyranella sp.]TAJ94769.1 MAG: A/G-specific adenine glycosylase [Reyranella sp.]TBR28907.1 MAG: A/G-specific adenine glycosylase [Reyranella sp.]